MKACSGAISGSTNISTNTSIEVLLGHAHNPCHNNTVLLTPGKRPPTLVNGS